MFLTREELRELTGRARKAAQIDQLRRMGIPYYLNAAGRPVVARAVIEGGKQKSQPQTWRPAVLGT